MSDLGLVGCSQRKLRHTAPARELYTSPLFRLASRYCDATYDRWLVLSARHGLIDPEQILAPYDANLNRLDRAGRDEWARLVLHAHRLRPLFGKGGGVENQDAIGFAQLGPDLTHQFRQQRLVAPRRLADELLQALPFSVMQVSDRLDVLAVQIRQQALDVVLGIGLLLRCRQDPDEGLQEGFQSWEYATQQAGTDFGIVEQFVQPDPKASLHRASPFSSF
jgi:hypothetical protein